MRRGFSAQKKERRSGETVTPFSDADCFLVVLRVPHFHRSRPFAEPTEKQLSHLTDQATVSSNPAKRFVMLYILQIDFCAVCRGLFDDSILQGEVLQVSAKIEGVYGGVTTVTAKAFCSPCKIR